MRGPGLGCDVVKGEAIRLWRAKRDEFGEVWEEGGPLLICITMMMFKCEALCQSTALRYF